tara:strand:+ start:2075 stop:3853 length:1779 start_codon:yes stop_codon:yes gene_type:complete
MGLIKKLSSELANQIAAGEVVERPASVVKELIENSLDAGATRISVLIEFGGKRLIRVEDNGSGMSPDDALLALKRHATSKLFSVDDLGAIETFGFRGEALPSIASVSRLILCSRLTGKETGTEIRSNAGAIESVHEIGMREGTTVEVVDLFRNIPARQKFLKADAAETSQVSRIVTQLALCYPEVGFALTNRGRKSFDYPPVSGWKERFYQIDRKRSQLVEVQKEAAGVSVLGYIAPLAGGDSTRGPQNVFVNRRIVKDKTISHAIHEAYRQATVKIRTPEVHLFIEIPSDRLDVNVHPTKAEVRFLEQSMIHELLRRALGDALSRVDSTPIAPKFDPDEGHSMFNPTISGFVEDLGVVGTHVKPKEIGQAEKLGINVSEVLDSSVLKVNHDEAIQSDQPVFPMIPLGQFRDTFIVAIDNEAISIIDQHVAHERVLFEQVMSRLTSGRLEGQRLLSPIVIELQPGLRDVLLLHGENLKRLAFEIFEFGGNSVQVVAVPALLNLKEATQIISALAEDLNGLRDESSVDDALRRIAATTACHAAVKANDRLTHEKMSFILSELRRTNYSTVCPHGRPIMFKISRRYLERSFERS